MPSLIHNTFIVRNSLLLTHIREIFGVLCEVNNTPLYVETLFVRPSIHSFVT